MFRASLPQALFVWSDLEAALRGEHLFGGHVAEIYVYRLMPRDPFAERQEPSGGGGERLRAAARGANEDLHDLLVHFCEERDASAHIEIKRYVALGEDLFRFVELGAWLKSHNEEHRWHVAVGPKGYGGESGVRGSVQGSVARILSEELSFYQWTDEVCRLCTTPARALLAIKALPESTRIVWLAHARKIWEPTGGERLVIGKEMPRECLESVRTVLAPCSLERSNHDART